MISLASPLLVGSWPWSAGELLLTFAAGASAVARHLALSARSDGDEAARERALARRGELRAAFGAGGRALAVIAGAIFVAWLALASTPGARAPAWAFAAGVVVAAAAAAVVGRLEESARARVEVAAASAPESAAEVAWEGGLVATFTATAAQVGATWLVSATTEAAAAPLGLAAGMALVASFAHFARRVRAAAPATVRALALMSVQSFALAAAAAAVASIASGPDGRARSDLVHFARLLVALGAAAPLALGGSAGGARGRPVARRLLAPALVLVGAGLLAGLFVAPVRARDATRSAGESACAAALLAGVALVVAVARLADHAAEADPARAGGARSAGAAPVAPPASRFLGGVLLAAALVVAAAAAGGLGVALAAAAAAAALPTCLASGFGSELLPAPADGRPAPGSDAERAASSAAVALAGWALLAAARRSEGGLDVLSADVAGGALVGAVLTLFIAASSRRQGSGGGANSTATGLRAMILPALLAVAAPFCAARLNPAAGGGMAAGVLLCGATAALLAPRTTAALFDRVVSLVCITFVLCAR